MQIIRNFQNINYDLQNTVLTIGNFDGVHLGHQEILSFIKTNFKVNDNQFTKQSGAGANLKSALLTFEPHPLKIIKPNQIFDQKIYSLAQKLSILKSQKLLDIVFVSPFNQRLANLSAKDFVENFLVKTLRIKHLVVGYDFIFGKDRLGNADLLEEMAKIYNFSFHQISAKTNLSQQVYSSTQIRNFISSGNIESANQMMGRKYQVKGIVIEGRKLARNLGFPTANFLPKKDLIRPKFGVYKVNFLIDQKKSIPQKYPAILNFGVKPTISQNEKNYPTQQPLFEVHIPNFNQDIYGKKITVEFLEFIREEKKFPSILELKQQIIKDVEFL